MKTLAIVLLLSCAAAAAAQECPAGAWLRPGDGRAALLPAAKLLADMSQLEVVLLGERHDDADHHRWQLHTLAALHGRRPEMVIGFEAFPRRVQPALDKWVAGELTAQQFLAEVRWDEIWNVPAELYLPLFEFARLHRVPLVALNVERKLTEAIAEKGWEAVPQGEREGVAKASPAPPAYRDELFDVYREHLAARGKDGEKAAKSDPAFRNFVEAQQTWDRAMAEALARRAAAGAEPRPLVVGIAGSGHLRDGYGIPLQLRSLGITRVGILLPIAAQSECTELRAGLADAVFALPEARSAKPPPPRLGVRLDQRGDSVVLAEVTAGSLAERSGLRKGDILVSIAGKPVARASSVVEAIRRQPEGTWLPLQIRRGAQAQEVVVKFPPVQ